MYLIFTKWLDFEKELAARTDKLVLVYFTAKWCVPCRTVGPQIIELAEKYENKIDVFKVDVEEDDQISDRHSVEGLPAFMIFDNENLLESYEGAVYLKDVIEFIEEYEFEYE